VIDRRIQTEGYWRDEFEVTDQDLTFLNDQFLEEHRPIALMDLARSLIVDYCRRTEAAVQRQLAKGTVYRPNAAFEIGEQVVFPHLDFAVGTVVSQREGHNPEYQAFEVITVEFEDGQEKTEFAAELQEPHKLAFADESSWESVFAISPDMLYDSYGELVATKLSQVFADRGDYVEFRGYWLPGAMAVDIHVGLLNIAEAMLVMQEKPLQPQELLGELDLPDEVPDEIKIFCLNKMVSRDERFIDVGTESQVVWSLQRWIPEAARKAPDYMRYEPVTYDRTGLDVTHLQLEREIDDEASQLMAPPTAAAATDLTLLLTYPHWRNGSLPLTARTRVFFPKGLPGQLSQITFLDRVGGGQFTGWVVHEHKYVYGLADWYEANNIPVGAHIRLERTQDPLVIAVDFVPRRMQREWTRMVVMGEDGRLAFTMQKRPIACEYDELCLIDELDREVGDQVRSAIDPQADLGEVTRDVFLELAKLTPSVAVHAKTLYSALNVAERCPPGRVFATLFSMPEFVTTGDGYWVYQGSA